MRTDQDLDTDTMPVAAPAVAWSLVVPLKPLALAKSRLAGAADDRLRPRLALAFAQDTVAAALACPVVRDVVVVTDDRRATAELAALGARIVPDAPAAGLNAALSHGVRTVRAVRPSAAVAALNADLPALRTAELERTLAAASVFTRAFLTDAAGIGTTLLCARPGAELRPAFGGPSRRAHLASGAAEILLTGVDSVRQDVDTGDDLAAALALGVGPRTAERLTAGVRAGEDRRATEGHQGL
ncbi:2-phospho-L-lactate guanylyltransferase [Streptomyces sp. NPDC006283]|uniref:2-phospho-L-lactate guanylyltransferase n=1 Tax=Streptomyces sp. NPDC006283 TaxID=3156741 RepID=UPI0033BD329C